MDVVPASHHTIEPRDVFSRPWEWEPVSRSEATSQLRDGRIVIVFRHLGADVADWFHPDHPMWLGTGPYHTAAPRLFRYLEPTERPTPPGGSGRVEPPPPPPPPPPPARKPKTEKKKALRGRFQPDTAWCGDEVSLDAEAQNIANGTQVTFDLRRATDKSSIETVTAPLSAAKVRGKMWVTKKPDLPADRKKDHVDFAASADGVSADSENKFTFKLYADKASETKTFACSSPPYGWTGKFDIALSNVALGVVVKIKLVNRLGAKPASAADPLPAIGPAVSAEDKAAMKADVEGKLSGKWVFHRKSCKRGDACDCPVDRRCCKIPVKITVDFVEAGEHHLVNLFQGNARANATNWTRVKTRDNSWAHETGHLLAWYDEYTGGAVGAAPRWTTPNPTAIMGSGLDVPAGYYWDFRDWTKTATGEDWNLVAP